MGAGNHRADDRVRVHRIADGQVGGAGDEVGDEFVIDAGLDDDPRAGGAALAIVGKDHENRRIKGPLVIRVIENDEGRLAAKLHGELLQAGGLDDAVAGHRLMEDVLDLRQLVLTGAGAGAHLAADLARRGEHDGNK